MDEKKNSIFIDADSFPKLAIDLVLRMAVGRSKHIFLVADRKFRYKPSEFVKIILVESGLDSADQWINNRVCVGDIVLTRDIVFAEILVRKTIFVVNHHGMIFDHTNILERRSLRDYRLEASLSGFCCQQGFSKNIYGKKELHNFAKSLDKLLVQSLRLHAKNLHVNELKVSRG